MGCLLCRASILSEEKFTEMIVNNKKVKFVRKNVVVSSHISFLFSFDTLYCNGNTLPNMVHGKKNLTSSVI